MRVFFFIVFLPFVVADCIAQSSSTQVPVQKDELIICRMSERPATTDMKNWKAWIAKNMAPDSLLTGSLAAGIYRMGANMIIDTCGFVKVDRIIGDPGYGIGERFKKVLESYPLPWIPAEQNGRKVKDFRPQPFKLVIEEEKDCVTEPAAAML